MYVVANSGVWTIVWKTTVSFYLRRSAIGNYRIESLICGTLGSALMPEVTYLTQILELYARNVRYPDKTKIPLFFWSKGTGDKFVCEVSWLDG